MNVSVRSPSAPRPDELVLELRGVGRRFGGRWVVRGLDVHQQGPGVVGLIGSNGSGKTSVLRMVAQLLTPEEGTVRICGQSTDAQSAAARGLVGYVPHRPLAWSGESVRANLTRAWSLAGRSRDEGHIESSMLQWNLRDVADQPVSTLSRGWAQRYALARADLTLPQVLLLDEPTEGLDRDARVMLDTAVDRWSGDRIVVVATHDHDWLSERATRIVDLSEAAR